VSKQGSCTPVGPFGKCKLKTLAQFPGPFEKKGNRTSSGAVLRAQKVKRTVAASSNNTAWRRITGTRNTSGTRGNTTLLKTGARQSGHSLALPHEKRDCPTEYVTQDSEKKKAPKSPEPGGARLSHPHCQKKSQGEEIMMGG